MLELVNRLRNNKVRDIVVAFLKHKGGKTLELKWEDSYRGLGPNRTFNLEGYAALVFANRITTQLQHHFYGKVTGNTVKKKGSRYFEVIQLEQSLELSIPAELLANGPSIGEGCEVLIASTAPTRTSARLSSSGMLCFKFSSGLNPSG